MPGLGRHVRRPAVLLVAVCAAALLVGCRSHRNGGDPVTFSGEGDGLIFPTSFDLSSNVAEALRAECAGSRCNAVSLEIVELTPSPPRAAVQVTIEGPSGSVTRASTESIGVTLAPTGPFVADLSNAAMAGRLAPYSPSPPLHFTIRIPASALDRTSIEYPGRLTPPATT